MKEVVIYNRVSCSCTERLFYSALSLLDASGVATATYGIDVSNGIGQFNILAEDFDVTPTTTPSVSLIFYI